MLLIFDMLLILILIKHFLDLYHNKSIKYFKNVFYKYYMLKNKNISIMIRVGRCIYDPSGKH